MRKEYQNSLTPTEVIKQYKTFKKILESCSTSLQRDNLKQELPIVRWKVEVHDIRNYYGSDSEFILNAIVQLHDPWAWWRGNEFDGGMDLKAILKGKNLKDNLLKFRRGQLVLIEGAVEYNGGRSFNMDSAKLIL